MSRTPQKGPKVTPLTATESLRHLDKAQQYLRAAQGCLAGGDLDAASGNAVLAGINAADCVSGAVQGNRWAGAHEQAAGHVNQAGEHGQTVATQLSKLIRKKTQAHCNQAMIRPREADSLLLAAERAVAAAERAASPLQRR